MSRYRKRCEMVDDATLVTRARAGDHGAFEAIVVRYSSLVGAIALGIVGDSSAAADVTQDSFLKAYRRLDSLVRPDRLRSWLGHIAHTTAIDWRRRRKHMKTSLDDVIETDRLAPETDLPRAVDPSQVLERNERRRLVLQAIQGLPPRYRQVVVLKHLQQASYQEISETLGMSVSAVESRLYRARALLRQRLERLELI